MNITDFLALFPIVKEMSPGRYLIPCPAHDDTHPSMPITEAENRILIHCRAGCRTEDVLAALGLDYRDLFYDDGRIKNRRV